jgi:hypothetical protein
VLEPVLEAGAQRALEDEAVRRSRVHRPGDVQEPLACHRLELAPQLVGAAQQRHVARMLEVGEPDHSCHPVGRALLVRHSEALDPEDAQAAAGEVEQGRAAETPDSDDDHVIASAVVHGGPRS